MSEERRARQGLAVAYLCAAMLLGLAGPAFPAAKPAGPINAFHEELLKLPPNERAAKLAQIVGNWCIGVRAFEMGVVAQGPRPGAAYWSLKCADGKSYAIEIDTDGKGAAIDCNTYKEATAGRQCFRHF